MPGTLFVVATPIGNLEDITGRALRVLREVAVIAAEDTRRTAHLLAHYAITTPSTSLHEHNEARKSAALIERLRRGDDIALVSDAGTPTVSDPGERLIAEAITAGIRVEPIPGPSAALAALAASGLPSDTFLFLGFPPTRSKDRKKWLDEVRSAARTVVFFEAPHRIQKTLEDLQQAIGDRTVAIGRELTKIHEELVRGPISTVLARLTSLKGEFTVVVDIGRIPQTSAAKAPEDSTVLAEFGVLTKSSGLDRKEAIARLAEKHGQARNIVYAAIERARKLGM
jgi:16S rRNA (cytidine1402-2'-O)-methyltransferase